MPLAAPTLVVADLETGGDASATIAGGNAGATNTLSYQPVTGELGGGTWTSAGSRTGPGSLAVDLGATGPFWFKVDSVLLTEAVVSNLDYRLITDGQAAVYDRILDAVQGRIALLGLPDLDGGCVRRRVPFLESVTLPCAVVTAFQQVPTNVSRNTQTDGLIKPVLVGVVGNSARSEAADPGWHGWMQAIFRAFSGQRLPGVPEVQTCEVVPGVAGDVDPAVTDHLQGVLTLNFETREVRGFGT